MAWGTGDGAVLDRASVEHAGLERRRAAGHAVVVAIAPRRRPSRQVRSRLPPCPELDCVRHLLPPGTLALAELRAAETGVGAERVLIAGGLLGEDTYYRALAASLRMPFEPLREAARKAMPVPDVALVEAPATGLLALRSADGDAIVVAPHDARRLIEAAGRPASDIPRRCRLTGPGRLAGYVAAAGDEALGRRAAFALRNERPQLSAGARTPRRWRAVALASAIAALAAPGLVLAAVEAALAMLFLAWSMFRGAGMIGGTILPAIEPSPPERELPDYTVLAPLYREARAVPGLVAALGALEYPVEKLQIVLVVEPDDCETQAAIAALQLDRRFQVLLAPNVAPRTKPKALNAALPFARGKLIAVYDAEDRPEPDQLKRVCGAFAAGDARLACVQAALTIDNTADSWLTRGIMAQTPQAPRRPHPQMGARYERAIASSCDCMRGCRR